MKERTELEEGYDLYIVKKNDGKSVRLANFWQIMRYLRTGDQERTEILMTGAEDYTHELLQSHSIIWWKFGNPKIIEATREDSQAEKEYQEVLEIIDTLPDIDPLTGSVGTLIKCIGEDMYKITDGVSRRID